MFKMFKCLKMFKLNPTHAVQKVGFFILIKDCFFWRSYKNIIILKFFHAKAIKFAAFYNYSRLIRSTHRNCVLYLYTKYKQSIK